MHLRSLERFDFDSVLFPYNHELRKIEQYRLDSEALIELCNSREIATQTIKSIARRRWPEPKPKIGSAGISRSKMRTRSVGSPLRARSTGAVLEQRE